MPAYKRKRNGKITWLYKFDAPGSTRENRSIVREFGFPTKQEAIAAEVVRRTDEQKKFEMRKAGAAGVAAALPTTLAMLLAEFMKQHAEEHLAPKTVERYREMAAYLAPELLAMPLAEITPLHLGREWARLLKSGGHTRKTKTPRAMEPKTVRNIAGLVSSAYLRGDQVGPGRDEPRYSQRPPKDEEARRAGAAALRAGPHGRVCGWPMVPRGVPGVVSRDRLPPRRGAGAPVVRHTRRGSLH